eukprot:1150197-Pelagomonas_calceolata.AAC.2
MPSNLAIQTTGGASFKTACLQGSEAKARTDGWRPARSTLISASWLVSNKDFIYKGGLLAAPAGIPRQNF